MNDNLSVDDLFAEDVDGSDGAAAAADTGDGSGTNTDGAGGSDGSGGSGGSGGSDGSDGTDASGADGGTVGDGTDGDGSGSGTDGDDILTGVERYLADYGIVGGKITYDDGASVDFDSLSADEQYTVLQSLSTDARPTVEEEYDLASEEIQLLNDIRNSNRSVSEFMSDVINKQVAKSFAARDANSVDYNEMPDDAIFLSWLKHVEPDLTEEEAIIAMGRQKENESIYTKQVASLRGQLNDKQAQAKASEEAEVSKEKVAALEADRYEIVSAVENIDNIGGAEVTDQMKNEVLHSLLEINDQGDPLIMEEMFSDPERLFKAAWFMKYGESYLDNVDKYWRRKESEAFKQGRQDVLNGAPGSANGMSRNDIIPKPGKDVGQGRQTGRPDNIDALWDD